MTDIVQKLWGFCHTLRHDGVDYGDYIEQLTYLLFLKMADEKAIDLSRTKYQGEDGQAIVINCSWPALEEKSGTALTDHYIAVLQALGKQKGLLGEIFAGALSRFTNPVNLKTLISLIDETEWTELGVDVKAAAFEGLLEKAASEGKKGAGNTSRRASLSRRSCGVLSRTPGYTRNLRSATRLAGRADSWSLLTSG